MASSPNTLELRSRAVDDRIQLRLPCNMRDVTLWRRNVNAAFYVRMWSVLNRRLRMASVAQAIQATTEFESDA